MRRIARLPAATALGVGLVRAPDQEQPVGELLPQLFRLRPERQHVAGRADGFGRAVEPQGLFDAGKVRIGIVRPQRPPAVDRPGGLRELALRQPAHGEGAQDFRIVRVARQRPRERRFRVREIPGQRELDAPAPFARPVLVNEPNGTAGREQNGTDGERRAARAGFPRRRAGAFVRNV